MNKAPQHRVPSFGENSFSCPHCGAFAGHNWFNVYVTNDYAGAQARKFAISFLKSGEIRLEPVPENQHPNVHFLAAGPNLHLSQCQACHQFGIWVGIDLVWPPATMAPPAHEDMPEILKTDFEEARTILALSPRGAAALLRLCIQKLCKELNEKGENINDDIAALVKKGLPLQIQQALDTVRVIGNNAVHPGKIDLLDDRATAEGLFHLLNMIIDRLIGEPKRYHELYQRLPSATLEAIDRRDGRIAGKQGPGEI